MLTQITRKYFHLNFSINDAVKTHCFHGSNRSADIQEMQMSGRTKDPEGYV